MSETVRVKFFEMTKEQRSRFHIVDRAKRRLEYAKSMLQKQAELVAQREAELEFVIAKYGDQ